MKRLTWILLAVALVAAGMRAPWVVAQTAAPASPVPLGKQVAVLVNIPIPAGLTRAAIEAEFQKAAPFYERLPGLTRKYFTISDEGKAGGIYLWESREAASAFYNEGWRARVLKTYGAPAEVSFFDVPVVVESKPVR